MYQRAGVDEGTGGSLSFIGTVSPAGGNFQEPVTQSTMDATGGFWGLSQDRADAKKYPAIDPLAYTTSVYEGFISWKDRRKILETLEEANGIDQTISTIGLKKVPVEKYVVFQKGQTIDFCILQQDAFHDLDACTRPDRLNILNAAVQKLIENPINFPSEGMEDEELKELVKTKFDELRIWWKDWNSSAASEDELAELEKKIDQFIAQEENAS
jgi:V/A-type H+-transporting ATPase subunit A